MRRITIALATWALAFVIILTSTGIYATGGQNATDENSKTEVLAEIEAAEDRDEAVMLHREESGEEIQGGVIEINPNIVTNSTTKSTVLSQAEDTEISKKGVTSAAPSYDARNESWYRAKIKNQRQSGLCWACAISTAAELSYARETGVTSHTLSPSHLGYFFYNRVNDPLGNTGGDKNTIVGSQSWYSTGGNAIWAFQAMSSWTGMADEQKYPLSQYGTFSFTDTMAYDNELILENAKTVRVYHRNDSSGNAELEEASRTNVKNAILQYGAVVSSYYHDDLFVEEKTVNGEDTHVYYDYFDSSSNHAITVIGWNDNISKDLFYFEPEIDGAWLVQNSWGTYCDYMWISYDDSSFASIGGSETNPLRYVVALDMQPADAYDNNFQYDGNAHSAGASLSRNCKAANIYRVPNEEKLHELKAVGFTNKLDGSADYRVDIYTSVTPSKGPVSGTKAYSKEYSTTNSGFSTVPLDEPVILRPGTYYSIVITAITPANIGVEKSKDNTYLDSNGNSAGIKFIAETKQGQSFWGSSSGNWTDVSDSNYCFRIKGFTNSVDMIWLSSSSVKVASSNLNYTGKTQRPAVKVTYGSQVLKEGTDYKVTYSNTKYPGSGMIKVTGLGKYILSTEIPVTIGKISGFKVKSTGRTSVSLRWDREPKVGYKIYRYKSGKYTLIKTISSTGTTKYTNTKLKRGKSYSYKMRSYVKVGGKYYYGPYTSVVKGSTKR